MYNNMIAITNRHLCKAASRSDEFATGTEWYNEYLLHIDTIASRGVKAIVLREKDMTEENYECLAREVMKICSRHQTKLVLHSFYNVAVKLNFPNIHLPLDLLMELNSDNPQILHHFDIVGTSVHSVSDAVSAGDLGVTYIFAGNIYETDCKKGLPGRGLDYLHNICTCVSVPVYAIGGITLDRMNDIINAGARGGCMMSGFMNMPV